MSPFSSVRRKVALGKGDPLDTSGEWLGAIDIDLHRSLCGPGGGGAHPNTQSSSARESRKGSSAVHSSELDIAFKSWLRWGAPYKPCACRQNPQMHPAFYYRFSLCMVYIPGVVSGCRAQWQTQWLSPLVGPRPGFLLLFSSQGC